MKYIQTYEEFLQEFLQESYWHAPGLTDPSILKDIPKGNFKSGFKGNFQITPEQIGKTVGATLASLILAGIFKESLEYIFDRAKDLIQDKIELNQKRKDKREERYADRIEKDLKVLELNERELEKELDIFKRKLKEANRLISRENNRERKAALKDEIRYLNTLIDTIEDKLKEFKKI